MTADSCELIGAFFGTEAESPQSRSATVSSLPWPRGRVAAKADPSRRVGRLVLHERSELMVGACPGLA